MAPAVPIEFAGQKQSRKRSFLQTMGKSRKYSKGHSSGFVPDYRHAVGTMGESEGLGSSGQVDTEMTVSEGSSAPKRKCISLNAESCDNNFGVPVQVLSLSKMSWSERKNLEMRLKMELEQVRVLQKKVASLSSNVVLSSSSDIRSCNDGQRRAPIESFHRSSEIVGSQGKKRPFPGRNGAHTKKSSSGRFEPVKQDVPANTSNAVLMKQCESLLNRLMQHQYGWVFNTPVDVVKLNIPDYFTVIKHPMDLGTIKSKIASGQYSSPLGFAADVRLTFSNAMTYNPPGNDVHFMAETLHKSFEVGWKAIEKKLPVYIDTEIVPSGAGIHIENETGSSLLSSKKKKMNPNDTKIKPEPVKRIMTVEEKNNLSTELESLLAELPENIVDFLKEHCFSGQTDEEEIEIDIVALSDETLIKLRKLLDDYLLEKQKKQVIAEPCEMELRNESGFSNSSMQPCKGNDQGGEDIDIVGGNDPPISSFPPVEMQKNAAHRNSKGASSSSSSSESGSSSSDSDSGSSSNSESDTAKASLPIDAKKENLNVEANLDKEKVDAGVPNIRNQSLNELGQVELNAQDKPIAVEADGNQDGESAPSERQVSPERLYRAALLRSRFADTIFKAQEKTLEKGEKQDPEKLRIEREELERKQKEDLARIQAEAKAAEEAKRKAEAEAQAALKREIEQQREAQRQALLQMEKTVDINENGKFMKDLEMLRAINDEHLPSFTEETSPDHSQNRLGSFKLQGNPLEQLGLYMKADEEEEDDNGEPQPPQSVLEPTSTNDVEEGEID